MTAVIINGKEIGRSILARAERERLIIGEVTLCVLVVGVNPVIETYVRAKANAAKSIGVSMFIERLPQDTTEEKIIERVKWIAKWADAMIVQLPLPPHINKNNVINSIPPQVDADILSDTTWKLYEENKISIVQPVAGAVLAILESVKVNLQHSYVAIVGNGRLVGAPTAILLERFGTRISLINSKTPDDARREILQSADVIVSGVGKQNLITVDDISEGVILIDGGTSESEGGTAGDIAYNCEEKASYFSRVPGGVGPITVAGLISNAVTLSRIRKEGR